MMKKMKIITSNLLFSILLFVTINTNNATLNDNSFELIVKIKEHKIKKIHAHNALLVRDYIKTHYPLSKIDGKLLYEKCLKYQIDVIFVIAQGHIESHMGSYGWAKTTNSVWNVGAWDKRIPLNWYTFANQSIEPYLILLKSNYLGKSKTIHDLLNNYVNLNNRRYASYKYYEYHLRKTYNKIKEEINFKEYG